MALFFAGTLALVERDKGETKSTKSTPTTASAAKAPRTNASRVGARLLPPPLPPLATTVESAPAGGRGILSDAVNEHCGCSERHLSPAVHAEDVRAIDVAWQAGDYARATAITASLGDLEDRRQILRPLLAEWVRTNPQNAAQFAQARPVGAERSELLETTIRAWAERDIAGASAWLNALEPHGDHEKSVVAIATNEILATHRPEIALSWAESVGAAELRWEAICTVAEMWARRDSAAALRYVESALILSTDERARMIAHVSQRTAVLE